MELRLSLDYTLSKADREALTGSGTRGITVSLIRHAWAAKCPAGIQDPVERRTWAGIERALVLAVDDRSDRIELSPKELDEVVSALESWRIPVGSQCVWVDELLEELERAKSVSVGALNGSCP